MTMRAALAALLLLFASFAEAGSVTIDNDASCDIADYPAATLLLPYFEVDISSSPARSGATTIFTVTNASHLPQAVRVTLWTNLAYPVLSFNIYLTGYDVQSINLYDVFVQGKLAPDAGTGSDVSPVGVLSGTSATREHDNPLLLEERCGGLPVVLPRNFITRMQEAFTGRIPAAGRFLDACDTAGQRRRNAVGYATMDVVGSCGTSTPADPSYFTEDIRFDNVLLGDYVQVDGDHSAQGETMVHIRALPEGGHPRDRLDNPAYRVNFPQTFYGRYLHPSRKGLDARQPLPSVFAARWISGGAATLKTFYKIWREADPVGENCRDYLKNQTRLVEIVRFDEDENPTLPDINCLPLCIPSDPRLPATAMIDVDYDEYVRPHPFPPPPRADATGGWMYLNLGDPEGRSRQGWVTTSMRADSLALSVDMSAQALGNGCSQFVGSSENGTSLPIGPLPNRRK